MTLYETGESNGMVSITELFDNPNKCIGCKSDTTLEDLFFATCRGGWPRTLSIRDRDAKLEIARDYYRQICNADISAVDNGLEADAVYQLSDGRYALIEIKVGVNSVPSAEKNLIKFSELINKHNKKAKENTRHPGVEYREPDLLIVICANAPMSYITENGVIVLPVGCIRD